MSLWQPGFSVYEQATAQKQTKRVKFLAEMEAWAAFAHLIEPHYPKTSKKAERQVLGPRSSRSHRPASPGAAALCSRQSLNGALKVGSCQLHEGLFRLGRGPLTLLERYLTRCPRARGSHPCQIPARDSAPNGHGLLEARRLEATRGERGSADLPS